MSCNSLDAFSSATDVVRSYSNIKEEIAMHTITLLVMNIVYDKTFKVFMIFNSIMELSHEL